MRTLLALLALAALPLIATFAPVELHRAPASPERSRVWAEPVMLDPERPGLRRIGRLVYRGGWAFESNDPRFGGISALAVDGRDVLALSDAGVLFGFSLAAAGNPQPLSVRQLLEGPGNPTSKLDRDTEAMAAKGRHLWVSYERNNVVWRYDRETLKTSASAAPAEMRRWRENSGSEAMVRLDDGRFLIFSERVGGNGTSEALLFHGDPALAQTKVTRLAYRPPRGYRITDAAALPGGGLLFLNRSWGVLDGWSARLTMSERPRLEEGAELAGEEIARIDTPLTTDNFEGLSVTREGDRTILWIASDDNFLALQRTLLLKFELQQPAAKVRRQPARKTS